MGYPLSWLEGVPPNHHDWMGYPPTIMTGWGTLPHHDWMGYSPPPWLEGVPPQPSWLDGVPLPPTSKASTCYARAVCLLRSRRRTFLFAIYFYQKLINLASKVNIINFLILLILYHNTWPSLFKTKQSKRSGLNDIISTIYDSVTSRSTEKSRGKVSGCYDQPDRHWVFVLAFSWTVLRTGLHIARIKSQH